MILHNYTSFYFSSGHRNSQNNCIDEYLNLRTPNFVSTHRSAYRFSYNSYKRMAPDRHVTSHISYRRRISEALDKSVYRIVHLILPFCFPSCVRRCNPVDRQSLSARTDREALCGQCVYEKLYNHGTRIRGLRRLTCTLV